MYRTRSPENNAQGQPEQFVEKLKDLPVVTDALGKLGALYTGTKEHNRLFRFTLQTAESGLGLVYSASKPLVNKFEKPIETLNGIACHQLEKLEQDYPIIAQPTEEVMKKTKETYVKPIADRVKPITDRVGSAARYGADKVHNAKQFTVGTIEGVANYGLNKVNDVKTYSVNKVLAASDVGSKQMSRVLENQASQLLIAQVGLIMNVADVYIDKYLPPDETDDKSPKEKNKKPESETPQGAVISQAWSMGSKVRRRAYNRAAKELKSVRMRSVDTLSKMNPVDLVEYARTNIDGMRGKVHYVWDEINKPAEEVAKEDTENEKNRKNLTYERRFIATARHLTLKVKAGAASLNLSIETVPGPFRPYVLQALEIAQSVFRYFLARPEHLGDGAETKRSVPSIKSSPPPPATSSPMHQQHQQSSPATTKKPDADENNREKAKKSPAASPAAATPSVTKDAVEGRKGGEGEKIERSVSSSSSEHQDDQTYAEPQDDSPDSYE